jgi:5-methylcytosine-specific restriction endonuclease McrA
MIQMNNSVLVLNVNFEPLNVCTARRAVGLILTEKAILVLNGRGEIHTINNKFPRPSVIQLQRMCHRPRLHAHFSRREVFRRDNYICQYCGKQTQDLTIDHVVPRSQGGLHTWENVVAACPVCNHKKGGRSLHESNLKLSRIPKEPPNSAYYIYGKHIDQFSEWEPFLIGW